MKWRLLAVACVLLALGLLLYPLMGELVSEKYHSDVEAVYTAAIAGTDDTELAEQRRAAEAYNALLRGEAAVSTGGASAPPMLYAGQLTVGGAMCTIDIPEDRRVSPGAARRGGGNAGAGRGSCGRNVLAGRRQRAPTQSVSAQRHGEFQAVFGY